MRFVLINIRDCIPLSTIDRWNESLMLLPSTESAIFNNNSSGNGSTQVRIRKSEVRWLRHDTNAELCREVSDSVLEIVNRESEVLACDYYQTVAPIQHTTYNEGCYYKQHIDSFEDQNKLYNRKVSISIALSDSSEYTGGKLIVKGREVDMSRKGNIAIFLSYTPHEVTIVESGVRRSLVAWIRGPQWR